MAVIMPFGRVNVSVPYPFMHRVFSANERHFHGLFVWVDFREWGRALIGGLSPETLVNIGLG